MAEFKQAVQFPRESEPDFFTFLSKFKNDWYRSHQDVYDIVYDSVREFAEDGLFYIELRFSPEHFALHNNFDRMEITRLVIDAANTAAKEAQVRIRYLITFNRGKQDQHEMIDLYHAIRDLRFRRSWASTWPAMKRAFRRRTFLKFFTTGKRRRLYGTTIHAGEVTPADQVWDSIHLLHAMRIGHGTTSIDDPELQTVTERRNRPGAMHHVQLPNRLLGGRAKPPVGSSLYRAGIPVTINSDDPTIQDTDLTDDYMKACSTSIFLSMILWRECDRY